MSGSEDKYILEQSKTELERLRINHEMFKRSLGGELLSPDIKTYLEKQTSPEDVKILDSGTADGKSRRRMLFISCDSPHVLWCSGTWLVDIAHTFPKAILTGTDISTSFFPASPSPSLTFFEQDISKPWPQDQKGKYGLVHQRLVLLAHGPNLARIMAGLGSLIKPGGWIQLIEMDLNERSGLGPAGVQFLTLLTEFIGVMGGQTDFLDVIPKLLEENGFEHVAVKHYSTKVGAKNEDEGARQIQAEMHRGPPTMIGGMLKGWCSRSRLQLLPKLKVRDTGKSSIPDTELETLPDRLVQEMERDGEVFVNRMIIGRKMA